MKNCENFHPNPPLLHCKRRWSQLFLTSRQQSPRTIFDFRSRFLCFQTTNQKSQINSKILCPQSPSILVPRLRRLRDEKRAMGTRMEWIVTSPNSLVPCHSQNEFRAHFRSFKMKDVWITVARNKVR